MHLVVLVLGFGVRFWIGVGFCFLGLVVVRFSVRPFVLVYLSLFLVVFVAVIAVVIVVVGDDVVAVVVYPTKSLQQNTQKQYVI